MDLLTRTTLPLIYIVSLRKFKPNLPLSPYIGLFVEIKYLVGTVVCASRQEIAIKLSTSLYGEIYTY